MTVFDNIAYPLRVRHRKRAEVRERVGGMLDLVRLAGFASRMPHELSGGQQQRVALARAVVFEPSLLLLDEPLGALDRKLREHMQLEILQLQRQLGLAVVSVTHDQSEALTMSDRVAIVHNGRLEQIGSPEIVYHEPRNRFVADFIGESSFLEGVVIDGGARLARARISPEFTVSFVPTTALSTGDAVVLMVRPEAIGPATVEFEAQNHVSGIVVESTYVGEFRRYRLRLPGDATLSMKRSSHAGTASHREGDRVHVAWRIEDTRQVERDSARLPA
jgi:putative spermidine/putrescine transport system ATP-binding protein